MHDEAPALLKRIRSDLDRSVEALDPATHARLAQARARALAPRSQPIAWWIPASGAVFATLLVALLLVGQPQPLPLDNGFSNIADLELLTGDDNLELFEDLEFWRWLESKPLDAG